MPTVLRQDGFDFYFYSEEGNEPPHIHVDKGGGTAKFWLRPLALEYADGLKSAEVKKARRLVEENQTLLLEKWHEHLA
ncbi:MAG: hypothetical protein RL514_4587 [Verrucomicrobiota bacterium]|jgi:hypothetical protein